MGYVRGPEVSAWWVAPISRHNPVETGWIGNVRLGGLLALGPSDGFDGAECAVEPGLLGGLHLIESQTQVVLQILDEREQEITAQTGNISYLLLLLCSFECNTKSSTFLIITPSNLHTERFVAVTLMHFSPLSLYLETRPQFFHSAHTGFKKKHLTQQCLKAPRYNNNASFLIPLHANVDSEPVITALSSISKLNRAVA